MNQLIIVGAGPGSAECMLHAATEAVAHAGYVFADQRFLKEIPHERKEKLGSVTSLPQRVRKKMEECEVAVVVSGDPLFYSLTKLLMREIPADFIRIIPGIGSLSYLAARCLRTTEQADFYSCHGRKVPLSEIRFSFSRGRDVYILCDQTHGPDWFAAQLCEEGLSDLWMAAGSRLSYADERVIEGTARELSGMAFDPLSVVALFGSSLSEKERAQNGSEQEEGEQDRESILLSDRAFIRDQVPMTREEVRWVILGKLQLHPDDIVWDIGAGTGSISVECARMLENFGGGEVYSMERDPNALALIEQNRKKFGLDHLHVIAGDAREELARLPIPSSVFIGGSGGELKEILGKIERLGVGIRVVTSCVTMETIQEALLCYQEGAFTEPDITQIGLSKGRKLGSYHLLEPAHTITLYSAQTK